MVGQSSVCVPGRSGQHKPKPCVLSGMQVCWAVDYFGFCLSQNLGATLVISTMVCWPFDVCSTGHTHCSASAAGKFVQLHTPFQDQLIFPISTYAPADQNQLTELVVELVVVYYSSTHTLLCRRKSHNLTEKEVGHTEDLTNNLSGTRTYHFTKLQTDTKLVGHFFSLMAVFTVIIICK